MKTSPANISTYIYEDTHKQKWTHTHADAKIMHTNES